MAKVRKSGVAVLFAVLLIAVGGYFVLGQVERDKARAAAAATPPAGIPVTVAIAEAKDVPVYIRVTQQDGHQAWSSPIYLIKTP